MTSLKPEINYKRWSFVRNQAIVILKIVKISLISSALIIGGSAMRFSVMAKGISLILIALFFYSYSYAASVKLKTGQIIEGEIVKRTDEYIKINYQGVHMFYVVNEIESVDGISLLPKPDTDIITFTIKKAAEYVLKGKTDEAVKMLEERIGEDGNNFVFVRLLEFINNSAKGLIGKEYSLHFFKMIDYWKTQQYQGVASEFVEALQIDSTEPFIYFVMSNICFGVKNVEEATKNLQKAVELYKIKEDFKAAEFLEKYL